MGALGIALLILGIPATGKLLLDAASRGTHRFDLGFAVALGFSSLMLALYTPLAVTGLVVFWPAVALLVAGFAYTLVALVRRRGCWSVDRFALALGAMSFAIWCVIAQHAAWRGHDGKAIYGFKAKVLLHERSVEGPAFQDVDIVHYHADYPLGLPLLMAFSAWVAEGAPEDPAGLKPAADAKAWVQRYDAIDAYVYVAALWALGLVALLYRLARARFGAGLFAAAATFVATPAALVLPWIVGRSWSWEGADLPLALCLGVAGLAALRALDPADSHAQHGSPVVAALATAGALLLKNDAVLALASLALVLACFARAHTRRDGLAALALGAAASSVVLMLVGDTIAGAPYDENYGAALLDIHARTVIERISLMARDTWNVLYVQRMLPYWLFVLLAGVPLALRAGGRARLIAAWLLVYLAACAGVFLITPNEMTWHITKALPRLWCQLGVAAGWLAITACAHAWGAMPARDAVPGRAAVDVEPIVERGSQA